MDLSTILKIPLFRSMTEQEIERVFAEVKIYELQFRKGEILAMQDEVVNRLIILLTGSVKGEMTDPSGKIVKVEDVKAPSPVSILFLFGENNRFPVQVVAREDGTAIVIPKQSVLKMLLMNEMLLKNYLDTSANFASRLSKKLRFMSFRTIRQKVAVYILALSENQESDTIKLDKSKSALAEYFGVARPSLEREITAMQNDGLISAERHMITINNKAKLIKMIND